MTTVLVCGGRHFDDEQLLFDTLDKLHEKHGFTKLLHGAQRGADTLAGLWADMRGVNVQRFPADWRGLGYAAGPIRNQQMLTEGRPVLVVAFPGGSGTADMVRRAQGAGVRVERVR